MYACVFRYRRTTCSGWIVCHIGVHGWIHFTPVLKLGGGACHFYCSVPEPNFCFHCMFLWVFISGLAFQDEKAICVKTTLDAGRNILRGKMKRVQREYREIYFTFHTTHTCTEPRASCCSKCITGRHHEISWCPLCTWFLKCHWL